MARRTTRQAEKEHGYLDRHDRRAVVTGTGPGALTDSAKPIIIGRILVNYSGDLSEGEFCKDESYVIHWETMCKMQNRKAIWAFVRHL